MNLRFTLKLFVFIALVFSSGFLFAQKQRLFIKSTRSGFIIDHKVQPKETFNSIASIYNISPDTLSEYNNMDYYEGELLAKNLEIPLRTENFYQKGLIDSSLAFIPVYHLTKSSQTVQQISAQFNKVPVTSLRLWNGIPKTGIVSGMQILVGYLKAQPGQVSYFEEATPHYIAVVEKPAVPKPLPEQRADSISVAAVEEKKIVEEPKVTKADTKPKEETKKEDKPEPAKPAVDNTIHIGFFKTVYKPSIPKEKVLTGDAAIFESKSGWNDGKYYVLMPRLKPGSIVKITIADKTVYAKVLGDLPVMVENKDIILRLSNAAAKELGVFDPRFPVLVTY